MIARRSLFVVPALLLAPALLEGCASRAVGPAVLHLTIRGSHDQNPDPLGHPAPVAVRLFLLRNDARFERANVFVLIAHQKQTLGPDLVSSEEFVISPGASLSVTRSLPTGTRFAAVAVLFRDIEHAGWRSVVRLASSGPSKLTLRISGTKATLSR